MDIHLFQSDRPGDLVTITRDNITGSQHAFIPHPLPPRWEFPLRLWPLLAEARQQLGVLEGIGRNLPNPGILLRPLADREAIRSSQLEGTYATARELLLFEIQPRQSRSEDDPANAQREVYNYRRALHEAANPVLPLSLRLVRDLHRTLLDQVRGRDRSPGEFRRIQVAIGSDHRFVPPPPHLVLPCLDRLEKYLHVGNLAYDSLVNSFLVHYQFETIHPFVDGNGRVGRLLLAIMLQQSGELSKPWMYLSEYFEKHREEYVERLFDVSARANWEGWVEFCLRGTIEQARTTIRRCDRLLEVREEFMKRLANAGGSARLNKIVESVFFSPFVRIADLSSQLGVTYPTAKADVHRLVRAQILKELKNATPKTFYAPEVFDVAYEELQ